MCWLWSLNLRPQNQSRTRWWTRSPSRLHCPPGWSGAPLEFPQSVTWSRAWSWNWPENQDDDVQITFGKCKYVSWLIKHLSRCLHLIIDRSYLSKSVHLSGRNNLLMTDDDDFVLPGSSSLTWPALTCPPCRVFLHISRFVCQLKGRSLHSIKS